MYLPLAIQFPQTFVPTAREVGLLPMVTELVLSAAMFAFAGAFVFFLASRTSVHPAHRASAGLTAVICLLAALAYWYLRYFYHDMLHQVAITNAPNDPAARRNIIRDAYFALSQYRYVNWTVAVPLLLLKMVLILKVKPREIYGWIAALIGASLWMILAAFIGDEQFRPDGTVAVGWHLGWGVVALAGYAAIPWILYKKLAPRFGGFGDDESGQAFRLMALSTLTTWAIYPLGFLLAALFATLDFNWIQILFTLADLVNLIGVGVVSYLAGAEALARRSPPEAVQPVRLAT